MLDVIFLSNRYPFSFLRRRKHPPLAVAQYLFNILKVKKLDVRRIRVDEDGSLDRLYEFNMLLMNNNIQLETAGRHGSKLNRIVERPNRECHLKTRIDVGLQNLLPKPHWWFSRERLTFIKRRTCHTGINSTQCFKWNNQPFNYKILLMFGTLGFR